MTAASPIARTFPLHRGVNQGIGPANQGVGRAAQLTRHPLNCLGNFLETTPITPWPIPAAQPVPRAGEVPHQVAPQKTGRPRDRDLHGAHSEVVPARSRVAAFRSSEQTTSAIMRL